MKILTKNLTSWVWHYSFFVCLILVGNFGFSQSFSANVSQNPIRVGDRFKLNFVLENATGKIIPPALTDFTVIFGPSQSSNFSYVNGKSSRTVTVSYILMADAEGTYTIDPAKAQTNNGNFTTKPLNIKVVAGNSQAQTPQRNNRSKATPTNNVKVDNTGNVIMQVTATKNSAYVGEPIVLSYTLYSRYSQLELGDTDYPNVSGFWVENLELGNVQWSSKYATINGMRYRKAIIKKQLLYPQRAGKFTIPSFQQNVVINKSFFNPGSQVSCNSNELNIEVKPYPSGAPADFANITGLFRVSATISANQTAVNEALTFKVKVSGSGNLKLLNAPEINFPSDFEVYEPKINDRIAVGTNEIKGSREWEYILIPRFPGQYQIPEVGFSYFNLASKTYKKAYASAIEIEVTGAANTNSGTPVVSSKTDVALLNKDIRYIETDWRASNITSFYAGKPLFWILSLLLVLTGVGAAYAVRKNQSLKKNVVAYKQRKASKLATKHLSKAKSELKKQNNTAFYIAIVDAIHGFLQDKFTLDKTQLSREALRQFLLSKGATEAQFSELQNLIDDCDMARYAPTANVNMETTFERAKTTLQWLEKL